MEVHHHPHVEKKNFQPPWVLLLFRKPASTTRESRLVT